MALTPGSSKPLSCSSCSLFTQGTGYVPAHGSGRNKILLVGEAPGEDEARTGLPFVGAAGFYLDRVLRRAGLDRAAFRVHNALSCRPPNNWLVGAPWEVDALQHCSHFLDDTIRAAKPTVIMALGNTALQRLTGKTGINRYRGRVLQGQQDGTWIVPTYHPSYLLPRKGQANTSRFVGAVIRDFKLAERIVNQGFARKLRTYIEDPTPSEFHMWVNACLTAKPPYLSFDIETPMKLKTTDEDDLSEGGDDDVADDAKDSAPITTQEPILRISFSYVVGQAISIAWQGPYIADIRRLLESTLNKVVWNGSRFDVPVLAAQGFPVGGTVFDYMWGWHVLQSDLPKGLEYVASFYTDVLPWKHEADARPAWYNATDADVALEIAEGVERDLRAAGQWDIFLRHVVALDPLLHRIGREGVHIDRARQDALKTYLQTEQERLIHEAQTLVPDDVRATKRYARRPDREGGRWRAVGIAGVVKYCLACGEACPNKSLHQHGKANPCKGAKTEARSAPIEVWDELLDFNPNSVKDLSAYATFVRHPLGVNQKTKRPSMDKQHVAKLAKKYGGKHPIYGLALELRSIKKTLGTYVIGFAPDAAGKIYTTYAYHPSTGRLSSRAVNLQNVSHKAAIPYASDVRRTIIPPPGMLFVEADSSAIEAVLSGYFMGSDDFIALARKSIHAFLTCYELGWDFIPENVDRVKRLHAGAYARNKQVVYLTLYGGGPAMMAGAYPEFFPSIQAAEIAQLRLFEACPALAKWQNDTRMIAHKNGYLVNPWNYRHWFYHVYQKTQDGTVAGTDANRCVAFLPQSSAGAFMKDNVAILAKTKFFPLPANGLVHDSYCLNVWPKDVDEAVAVLKSTLTRPIPELGGLTIGCEIKVGPNWDEMVAA